MYIVLSVLLGVLIGALLPWSIPAQYSIYAAVMLLAALDAAAGGIDARLHHKFRAATLFVSGALGNGLIAVFLHLYGRAQRHFALFGGSGGVWYAIVPEALEKSGENS